MTLLQQTPPATVAGIVRQRQAPDRRPYLVPLATPPGGGEPTEVFDPASGLRRRAAERAEEGLVAEFDLMSVDADRVVRHVGLAESATSPVVRTFEVRWSGARPGDTVRVVLPWPS